MLVAGYQPSDKNSVSWRFENPPGSKRWKSKSTCILEISALPIDESTYTFWCDVAVIDCLISAPSGSPLYHRAQDGVSDRVTYVTTMPCLTLPNSLDGEASCLASDRA